MPELPDIVVYIEALEQRILGEPLERVNVSDQTAGKLLADRALSRLLRSDWPRTADELEGLTRQ